MQLRPLIQALAAVWLLLFVVSFLALRTVEADAEPQSGLARVAAFLTWQIIAFVVAMVAALATRHAVQRGVERVRAYGYVPLALSVFLVASFIVLMAFRVFVLPAFA
jgi:hypothetical protein